MIVDEDRGKSTNKLLFFHKDDAFQKSDPPEAAENRSKGLFLKHHVVFQKSDPPEAAYTAMSKLFPGPIWARVQ